MKAQLADPSQHRSQGIVERFNRFNFKDFKDLMPILIEAKFNVE